MDERKKKKRLIAKNRDQGIEQGATRCWDRFLWYDELGTMS